MTYQQHVIGKTAEQIACQYLLAESLTLVVRNYTCRFGEIDLIMQDRDFLVFIEVRTRSNQNYASALESIDYRKQQKLINTAQFYLQTHHLIDKVPCRFDVIAVSFTQNGHNFDWIKNAF